MPAEGFRYTQGAPKRFARSNKENAVTREFCPDCGTHLTSRRPGFPPMTLKIGTLDDPALFGGPQMAIFTEDAQSFHHIADGLPAFEQLPPRR